MAWPESWVCLRTLMALIHSRRQPFPYAGAEFFKNPAVEKAFRRIWDGDPGYTDTGTE